MMPVVIEVRALVEDDLDWKRELLTRAWGSTSVARQGTIIDALALDGFAATSDGAPVGLLTYAVGGPDVEVVTLNVEQEGRGIGRALMDAVKVRTRQLGAQRLWLSTTDNNVRARRFYAQWGMKVVRVIEDGVAVSRVVKPSIPLVDAHGVPIRDELVFELGLPASG